MPHTILVAGDTVVVKTNISAFRELHPVGREDVKVEINKILGVFDGRNIMRNKAGKRVESVNECVCACIYFYVCEGKKLGGRGLQF